MPRFPVLNFPPNEIVSHLNYWWSHGSPSNDLSRAGLLVHMFDNTENDVSAKASLGLNTNDAEPWLPCDKRAWCGQYAGRFSASIINARQRGIFRTQSTAGIILSPHTKLFCGYPMDGGTMQKFCPRGSPKGCAPGCATEDGEPNWCPHADAWSDDPSAQVFECAFRPRDMEAMLRMHLHHRSMSYNEVVVDTNSWTPNLPDSLLAVFFLADGTADGDMKARDVWERFRRRYPGSNTPLVRLDLNPGTRAVTQVA